MPQREAALHIDTLAIEGGLFTAEWLAKVAAQQAPVQADADYGVRAGFTLREEIALAWRSAQALWSQFNAARAQPHHDAWAVTHRFTTELLRQCFAFQLLQATQPRVIDERHYPVPFSAIGGRVSVVLSPHDEAKPLDTSHERLGDNSGERIRRRSAFGLLQETLNAQPDALWGLATNGLLLRIARDNASLTRPAWVEADLERLFVEERFADFSVLWLLLHSTRFGNDSGASSDCALEQWRSACREQGTRARETLRVGVEQALLVLGQGFVSHPANTALREALATGALSGQDYFKELLRLVYRQIFLLTIEEREILHPPGADVQAVALYAQGYGLRRLRDRAVRRSAHDRYGDLWQGLRQVWQGMATGQPLLALPPLGGLFEAGQCPHLDAARLENRHLLLALFHLAWLRANPNAPLTRVNWRDMGPEELGSIYESLLELEPQLTDGHRTFGFRIGAAARGNARKTSGSYYTPDPLVQLLLDSALEPVIADKLAAHPSGEGAVEALLSISVIDPACGSGHFLLAAARRIAVHLARVNAQIRDAAVGAGGQPTPDDYRHALRRVVAQCIYGVDLNPMAVELCRVALWLESLERDRPLGFLDAHIRCGNALLGVHDLAVLRTGIPNEAYAALKNVLADASVPAVEADNAEACAALKRRNNAERRTPVLPLAGLALTIPTDLGAALERIDHDDDATLAQIEAKRALFESVRAEGSMAWRLQTACDLWTAAFFAVKRPGFSASADPVPTSDALWRFLADPESLGRHVANEAAALRERYRFFHWPLEFPEVFKSGGFSLVLGNPPWETMSPDAKEWFAKHDPEIASLSPDAQGERIAELLALDSIRLDWERHARDLYAAVRFAKESGRYRLFAPGNLGKGDFNVYRQFVETALAFSAPGGAAAQIVPENFYNGANATAIREEVLNQRHLEALFGFENHRGIWFPGIDTRMKFALYIARRKPPALSFKATFAITNEERIAAAVATPLQLPVDLIREFSPETLGVMEFSNQFIGTEARACSSDCRRRPGDFRGRRARCSGGVTERRIADSRIAGNRKHLHVGEGDANAGPDECGSGEQQRLVAARARHRAPRGGGRDRRPANVLRLQDQPAFHSRRRVDLIPVARRRHGVTQRGRHVQIAERQCRRTAATSAVAAVQAGRLGLSRHHPRKRQLCDRHGSIASRVDRAGRGRDRRGHPGPTVG